MRVLSDMDSKLAPEAPTMDSIKIAPDMAGFIS
jgi:hypothetical protein